MHSARPSSGGSVRSQSSRYLDASATKTTTLGQFFGAEFGTLAFVPGRVPRRLPHHPSAPGYGHP